MLLGRSQWGCRSDSVHWQCRTVVGVQKTDANAMFVLLFSLCLSLVSACDNLLDGVCVCTAEVCDTVEPLGLLTKGQYAVYQSSKKGLRLAKSIHNLQAEDSMPSSTSQLKMDISQKFQSIIGFGGAFTDAATSNFNNVSEGEICDSHLSSWSRFCVSRIAVKIARELLWRRWAAVHSW